MKWVIVSDNHGQENILTDIKSVHSDADLFFHLGDSEFDFYDNELKDFIKVAGNCDYGDAFDPQCIVHRNEINVFVTHGHRYAVNTSRHQLASAAAEHHCQLAFYGHTHIKRVETIQGVVCINPGSIAQSRSNDPESYAVITFDESEKVVSFLNRQHEIIGREILMF